MIKTLKWIYRLGQQNERRRIRLLIAEHRKMKPSERDYTYNNSFNQPDFDRDFQLWFAVNNEMERLTSPRYVEQPMKIKTDLDDLL
jgi:hypothetical protein